MIETERLMIRPWQKTDVPHWNALALDVGYNVFSAPPGVYLVKDYADAVKRIEAKMKAFDDAGISKMPIFKKSSGAFVGTCGADFFDLEGRREIELGYRLMLDHWGKGYATEASRAMTDYLLSDAGFSQLHAFVHPYNRASVKVLEKLDFDFVRGFVWAGLPHRLYRISR